MARAIPGIRVLADGEPMDSATTLREAGPWVTVFATTVSASGWTFVTTYIGADDVDTTVVAIALGPRPDARREVVTTPRDMPPATHARELCLLDHLDRVTTTLRGVLAQHVTVDDDATAAAR